MLWRPGLRPESRLITAFPRPIWIFNKRTKRGKKGRSEKKRGETGEKRKRREGGKEIKTWAFEPKGDEAHSVIKSRVQIFFRSLSSRKL